MSGGTNRKIKDQNKAIKKQYKYDRKFHDYTHKTNLLRYEQAVADTNLQQANYDAQREFKDAVKAQEFKYQSDLQQRQFDLDKTAYRQSLEDYDKQTEFNSLSAAIAKEAAERKQKEALISRNFGLEGQKIDYSNQRLNLREKPYGVERK